MKKFFILLIFLFISAKLLFAQEIDCSKIIAIPCNEIGSFEIKILQEKCGQKGVLDFSQRVKECQKALREKKEESTQKLKLIESKEDEVQKIVNILTQNIYQLNLTIANLNLRLEILSREIQEKEKKIEELNEKLEGYKINLSSILRQIYEYDSFNSFEIFLKNKTISEFTQEIEFLEKLEKGLKKIINEINKAKENLEKEKESLQQKKEKLIEQKKLNENNRQNLSIRKKEQDYLLTRLATAKSPLEKEIVRIEAKLIELREAMEQIKSYLLKWTLTGNVTWSSIFSAVKSASQVTGVRMALLLGVLQAESTFGKGLGIPGKSKEYCIESWDGSQREYEALKLITQRFGYDAENVPMSRRCAIGPAQFLPTTWLGYEKICPGIYNPWDLNHAVLAMACYLARNGATSGNEGGALYAYNHANWYGNKVLNLASDWQRIISICGGLDLNCPNLKEKIEAFGIPEE